MLIVIPSLFATICSVFHQSGGGLVPLRQGLPQRFIRQYGKRPDGVAEANHVREIVFLYALL
jgi:hypothetical protein